MGERLETIIYGDYVAVPVKNAFNKKTSYWLSKKGYMVAVYMFTVEDCSGADDLKKRLSNEGMDSYVRLFEEKVGVVHEKIYWNEGRPKEEGSYLIQDEDGVVEKSYFYKNGNIFRYEMEGGRKVIRYTSMPKGKIN